MHVNIPQKLAILCQNSTTFTFEKYENMSLFEVTKNNAVVYFDQRLGAAFLVAVFYTSHLMHSSLQQPQCFDGPSWKCEQSCGHHYAMFYYLHINFLGSLWWDYRWNPSLRSVHRVPIKNPLQWFCGQNPLMGVLETFFHWYLCNHRYYLCWVWKCNEKYTMKKNMFLPILY